MHDTLALLKDLIAIDSVNPTLVPGAVGERGVADRLADEMRAVGLEVEVREAASGRPNVVGVLDGTGSGRTLMLCGHMDTVGVAGMTAPFDPIERDGRLYGRGAQDMKSGLAAMVGASAVVARNGLPRGRLVVAAVVDEEHESIGAEALVAAWSADGAVVTEPTDLAIALGHKGFAWVDVETRGRAAHGSRPRDGRDAILDMGRVVGRLDALDRELQQRAPHPLLGAASLHASVITGGREMSVYPDRCSLSMERRTLVGESGGVALAEVETILRDLKQANPAFVGSASLTFERPAYEIPADHPLPQALAERMTAAGLAPTPVGMSFWTDAAILAGAGIPSVLFGPTGQGLHSPEEHVELDSVLTCRDVLAELARVYCASARPDQSPNDRWSPSCS